MIYLDYTAHMPASKTSLDALVSTELEGIGNANAHHNAGRTSMTMLWRAQRSIAELLSVDENEMIFTSGASESNNTAIQGIAYASRHFGRHIITSPLEHPSVSGCLTALQERGYEIEVLPIEQDGIISLDDLRDALRQDTVLVTLCAVDSELGCIQPIGKVKEMLQDFPHCRLHLDATQAIGKIPLDLSFVDTASFSGHKFGGITGSGGLIRKNSTEMEPLIHGGVSASLYRSGTPAVGLAASLSAALADAQTFQREHMEYVTNLNHFLRHELKRRKIRIHSPSGAIPHILNVGIDGIKGNEMRSLLDEQGICVSVKSACSVENTPSRAVFAVTGNRKQAMESWRISLSHLTTMEELSEFLQILDFILKEKRT